MQDRPHVAQDAFFLHDECDCCVDCVYHGTMVVSGKCSERETAKAYLVALLADATTRSL